MSLLAKAQEKNGRVADALNTLVHARQIVEDNENRAWEAEVLRLTGDFRLRLDQTDADAESFYNLALGVARQQGARSLELRAAMSLARLLQRQGKNVEAHHMLAKIYGWFTEGFETKDLQEAKALLKGLSTQE